MAAASYKVNDDSDSLSSGDKRVGFDFVTEDLSWSPGHDLTWSPGRCERRRRDSGYGTDSSPARMATPRQLHFNRDARGSGMRQLNFDLDTPDFVNDLMNIHKDALKDSSELQGELSASNNLLIDNRTIDYESDDADKEVEDLFMKSCELGNSDSVSQSMNTQRPSAPVPISEECFKAECCVTRDCEWNVDTDYSDLTNSHPCHQTPCYTISHYNRHYFRPICNSTGSDSLGQEYHVASSDFKLLDILRCQQCHKAERSVTSRPRTRSEGEVVWRSGNLPDLVPTQHNRPISLPDLLTLHQRCEQEMGRELRRIGDEFEFLFRERKKHTVVSWKIFGFMFNIHLSGCLGFFRGLLSPSQQRIKNR